MPIDNSNCSCGDGWERHAPWCPAGNLDYRDVKLKECHELLERVKSDLPSELRMEIDKMILKHTI